jgi:hypothetical protein
MTHHHSTEDQLLPLSADECLALLASHQVGRLSVTDHGCPVAYPVNYQLIPNATGHTAIVIRTRAHGCLDHPNSAAGFEIDGTDSQNATGWSVVVRGTLLHADAYGVPTWVRDWDPRPWLSARDTWMYLRPISMSGRRLVSGAVEWAFSIHGYV